MYIAGSTAYRGGVTKAIQDLLNAGSVTPGPNQTGSFLEATDNGSSSSASAGTSIYGNTAAIFSGTYNGQWTIIHTYWTGSVAGCVDEATAHSFSGWLPDDIVKSGTYGNVNGGTMADTYPAASSGTAGYTGGLNVYSNYTAATAAPNVAMSDVFATSAAKSVQTASGNGATYYNDILNCNGGSGLTQAGLQNEGGANEPYVGLLPFVWVAGVSGTGTSHTYAPFNNMTQEAASQLVTAGYVSVSCLTSTGGPLVGDTNDYAFLIGRNEDSGTRATAQAEAQSSSAAGKQSFGASMKQYYLTYTNAATGATINHDGTWVAGGSFSGSIQGSSTIFTGGTGTTVTDFGLWPIDQPLNTEPTIAWNNLHGHSGQIGGGDVAKCLEADNPLYLSGTAVDGGGFQPTGWNSNNPVNKVNAAYFVGYLGASDANGANTSGAPVLYLSYNGVPYSASALLNGAYDFWSFEHMYYVTTGTNAVSGNTQYFIDYLDDKLYTLDCQTDSKGNTDSSLVPTNNANGGLRYTQSLFNRSQEGAAITPIF